MMAITRGPAPASLSKKKSYTGTDVVDTLHKDFLEKCYLCEGILTRGDISVEHRIDQALDPTRVYDWTNLYPAHQSCNNRRPTTRTPLLCPGTDTDLEDRLSQQHDPHGRDTQRFLFSARNQGDLAAENTDDELHAIHCEGSSPRSKWTAQDLRADIEREINIVLPARVALSKHL